MVDYSTWRESTSAWNSVLIEGGALPSEVLRLVLIRSRSFWTAGGGEEVEEQENISYSYFVACKQLHWIMFQTGITKLYEFKDPYLAMEKNGTCLLIIYPGNCNLYIFHKLLISIKNKHYLKRKLCSVFVCVCANASFKKIGCASVYVCMPRKLQGLVHIVARRLRGMHERVRVRVHTYTHTQAWGDIHRNAQMKANLS